MSLSWKIFLSYVVVVAIGLLVLAISTAYVAPETFSTHMNNMHGQTGGMMNGSNMLGLLEDDLGDSFRESVNSALLQAGIAAILAAGVVSWLIGQRIVRPIRQLAVASQNIAAGHYEQRLVFGGKDELGQLVFSFNQMAQSLADTEKMRQALLADVSHELKTPLASITGYMEGLQDGVIPATPDTFKMLHREAARLQRLVRDLQELSRIEAGAVELNIEHCDPIKLAEQVIDYLQPQFEEKAIRLTTDWHPPLPAIQADRDRIAQVLTNLLGNALQHTPAPGEVTVSVTQLAGVVEFAVCDTGTGLTEEDLTRIFHRFYRVDKSRSRSSGGSGIGLTIAQHLVEAHGGRIWAESLGPGAGSTFHFVLPCV